MKKKIFNEFPSTYDLSLVKNLGELFFYLL